MMRIWTSRYQNKTLAARDDLVKVGITLGKPRFRLGYTYVYLRLLAPSSELFREYDRERFTQGYFALMEELGGPSAILAALQHISNEHGGRDLVLLCYEDVSKPGEWCHRRILAEYMEQRAGIDVPELGMGHPEASAGDATQAESGAGRSSNSSAKWNKTASSSMSATAPTGSVSGTRSSG